MMLKNTRYRSSYAIAEEICKLDFLKRVSDEIMKAINDPECSCPVEAKTQWAEMSENEKIAFVSGGLECFYWIYISRRERDQSVSYPSWKNTSTNQQVITAASFCMFILGTEFEQLDYDGALNMDALPSNWIN
jgi:hypothetical protein